MQISELKPDKGIRASQANRLCALVLVFLLGLMSFFAGSQSLGYNRPGFSDFGGRGSSLVFAISAQEEHEVIGHGRDCNRRSHRIQRPDHPDPNHSDAAHTGEHSPTVALQMPDRALGAVRFENLPPPLLRGPPSA